MLLLFDLLTLKNKRARYFTSNMDLFRNSRGIAVQDKQTMANRYRQVRRTEGRDLLS